MSFWQAIAQAGHDLTTQAVGTYQWARNRNDTKKANKQTIEANERQLQNQHQWEVADLEAAGLNPLLSANSGAGVANNSQGGFTGNDGITQGSSAAAAASKFADFQRLENETKVSEATAEKLKSEKGKIDEETGNVSPLAQSIIKEHNSQSVVNSAKAETERQQQRLINSQVQLAQLEQGLKSGEIDIQGYTKKQLLQDIERNMKSLRVETVMYENELQKQLLESEYITSKFGKGSYYVKRAWDDNSAPIKSAIGAYLGYKGAQSAKHVGDAIRNYTNKH